MKKKIKEWLILQKYRFDLASRIASTANLVLSTLILSKLFHLDARWYPLVLMLGFFSVWLIGWLLDRFRFQFYYDSEVRKRSQPWIEINGKLDAIKELLEDENYEKLIAVKKGGDD